MNLNPISVLKIGTSQTTAIVAQPEENGNYSILGIGTAKTTGMRKSDITDMNYARIAVRTALDNAEKKSDTEIRSISLVYSGGAPQTKHIQGTTSIRSHDGTVSESELDEACNYAHDTYIEDDREVIEDIRQGYVLDETRPVMQPIGMSASSIKANFLRLHVDKNRLSTVKNLLVNECREVNSIYHTGLTAAIAASSKKQREDGVLVINLGAGSTSWCAYKNGFPQDLGTISIGGDHITNDIVCAFNIDKEEAERIKKTDGSAIITNVSKRISINKDLQNKSIPYHDFNVVINARIDETIRIIHDELEKSSSEQLVKQFGSGVILCGGGALLRGLPDLVSNIFSTPCSVFVPQFDYDFIKNENINTRLTSILGALKCETKQELRALHNRQNRSLLSRIFGK